VSCDDGDPCTIDTCENGECSHTQSCNQISVTVVLEYVAAPENPSEALERCIHFVPRVGVECGTPIDVPVQFTGDPATGEVVLTAPPDEWTSICAKDEQHTLFDTVDLVLQGSGYVALDELVLMGGDTNNNSWVEIMDVTLFLAQMGMDAVPGGCPWSSVLRDADFGNDGNVWTMDYTFLSGNWLEHTECPCDTASVLPPNTIAMRAATAVRTAELPVAIAQAADLNRDGTVDYRDVRLFERLHDLPSTLSDVMERTTPTPRSAPAEAAR
jgi:hypothetical protein